MTHRAPAILHHDPSANGTFSAWDQFGQITDQKWTNNGSTADRYQYAYDTDGNREYRQNSGPSATNLDEAYTYDTLERVTDLQRGTLSGTTISGTPAREQVFTLDELGNWPGYLTKTSGTTDLTQTRTHSTTNEITGISGGSWIVPTYDTNGNMKDMPIPGNETVKQTAVYDAWNRMVEMEDHTGAEIAIYAYNGLNQRVSKRLPDGLGGYNYGFDYYYNENWQVIEETETIPSGGGHTFTYAQYVWDARYIDAPVCRFRNTNLNTDGTEDETLYYATDANMNVTALLDPSDGSVKERYSYDAYGQVHISDGSWTARTSSSYDNQILFGGYRYDPETGPYHVRYRMYHPTLGRWTSREPSGSTYVYGTNLYLGLDDNPVLGIDPSGRFVVVLAVAVVIGVAALLEGCGRTPPPAPPTCGNFGVANDPTVPVLDPAQQLVLGDSTAGFDVKFVPKPCACPGGTIFIVQAINGHFDTTKTSTNQLNPPPKGTLPPGYVKDGGLSLPGDKNGGYRDGPNYAAPIEACAICDSGGVKKKISCVTFNWDPAKGVSNVKESVDPGGVWVDASKQWAGIGGKNY